MTTGGPVLAPLFVGLAAFIIVGAWSTSPSASSSSALPAATSFARARGLPRAAWGTAVSHAGVGVMLLGIVGETAYKQETIVQMRPGDSVQVAGYDLTLQALVPVQGPNYRDSSPACRCARAACPSARWSRQAPLHRRNMPTTEAALKTRGVSQLYVSRAMPTADGSIAMRFFYKPMVLLIWIGTLVMMVGGLLSLSDRRLRSARRNPPRRRAAAVQAAE